MSLRQLTTVVAAFGTLALVSSQALAGPSPRNQVRAAYLQECKDRFAGMQRLFGICMQGQAKRIRQLSEESREAYRDCLADYNDRDYCDQQRNEFWLSELPSGGDD